MLVVPLSPISLFTSNGYRPDFFGMTEAEQGLVGGEVGWCDRGAKGCIEIYVTVFVLFVLYIPHMILPSWWLIWAFNMDR